jgi:hypothetical protein
VHGVPTVTRTWLAGRRTGSPDLIVGFSSAPRVQAIGRNAGPIIHRGRGGVNVMVIVTLTIES